MLNKYKNSIAKTMLGVIAFATISSSITLADDYAYVNAAHLNVRSQGSVKGKIVAVVDSGYKVTVLETLANGWKKVLLENGETGYVNGKYIVNAEPAYEKVTASRYTIKSGDAFLRGFDLKRIAAVLSHGDILEVTSEKVYLNRWIQVKVVEAKHSRYIGRVGYIAKRLLNELDGYAYNQNIMSDEVVISDSNNDSMNNETYNTDVISTENEELNSAPVEDTVTEKNTSTGDLSTSEEEDSSVDDELANLLKGL